MRKENSIVFSDGSWLRNTFEMACEEEGVPAEFWCGTCGKSKLLKDLTLQVRIDNEAMMGVCRDCHISMVPESTASRLLKRREK